MHRYPHSTVEEKEALIISPGAEGGDGMGALGYSRSTPFPWRLPTIEELTREMEIRPVLSSHASPAILLSIHEMLKL